MGGGTSLVAAGEGRVDASALIMVDIAPRIEMEGIGKIRDFMAQKPEGFSSLEEVAEAIGTYQPQRERPKNLAGLVKNVRLGADGKYHWHWDPLLLIGCIFWCRLFLNSAPQTYSLQPQLTALSVGCAFLRPAPPRLTVADGRSATHGQDSCPQESSSQDAVAFSP